MQQRISYVPVKRSIYPRQDDVTKAWMKGHVPPSRTLRTPNRSGRGNDIPTITFEATQNKNGSGIVYHYSTIETLRTRSGLIVVNEQCWATGFACCSPPDYNERDATLPLTLMKRVVGEDKLFSIIEVLEKPIIEMWEVSWCDDETCIGNRTSQNDDSIHAGIKHLQEYESGTHYLVKFSDGTSFYIGKDMQEPWERRKTFAFRLSRKETGSIRQPDDALELLKPDEVKEAERQGIKVIRQGQWYFIPMDESFRPININSCFKYLKTDNDGQKKFVYRTSPLLDHYPQQWSFGKSDNEIVDFVKKELQSKSYVARQVSNLPETAEFITFHKKFVDGLQVFARGQVRHRTSPEYGEREHRTVMLGKRWHKAVKCWREIHTWDGRRRGVG